MKACLPLQYTQFNVSLCQWFYRYWIFAMIFKSFGDFCSIKCSLCLQSILQYIPYNLYFCSVLLCSVGGILRTFSAFLADISAFSPCAAANFPALFCQILNIFSLLLVSLFLSFLQFFSNSPFRQFLVLFQLKSSFIFLNFSLNFCLFQLYVIIINLCQ